MVSEKRRLQVVIAYYTVVFHIGTSIRQLQKQKLQRLDDRYVDRSRSRFLKTFPQNSSTQDVGSNFIVLFDARENDPVENPNFEGGEVQEIFLNEWEQREQKDTKMFKKLRDSQSLSHVFPGHFPLNQRMEFDESKQIWNLNLELKIFTKEVDPTSAKPSESSAESDEEVESDSEAEGSFWQPTSPLFPHSLDESETNSEFSDDDYGMPNSSWNSSGEASHQYVDQDEPVIAPSNSILFEAMDDTDNRKKKLIETALGPFLDPSPEVDLEIVVRNGDVARQDDEVRQIFQLRSLLDLANFNFCEKFIQRYKFQGFNIEIDVIGDADRLLFQKKFSVPSLKTLLEFDSGGLQAELSASFVKEFRRKTQYSRQMLFELVRGGCDFPGRYRASDVAALPLRHRDIFSAYIEKKAEHPVSCIPLYWAELAKLENVQEPLSVKPNSTAETKSGAASTNTGQSQGRVICLHWIYSSDSDFIPEKPHGRLECRFFHVTDSDENDNSQIVSCSGPHVGDSEFVYKGRVKTAYVRRESDLELMYSDPNRDREVTEIYKMKFLQANESDVFSHIFTGRFLNERDNQSDLYFQRSDPQKSTLRENYEKFQDGEDKRRPLLWRASFGKQRRFFPVVKEVIDNSVQFASGERMKSLLKEYEIFFNVEKSWGDEEFYDVDDQANPCLWFSHEFAGDPDVVFLEPVNKYPFPFHKPKLLLNSESLEGFTCSQQSDYDFMCKLLSSETLQSDYDFWSHVHRNLCADKLTYDDKTDEFNLKLSCRLSFEKDKNRRWTMMDLGFNDRTVDLFLSCASAFVSDIPQKCHYSDFTFLASLLECHQFDDPMYDSLFDQTFRTQFEEWR